MSTRRFGIASALLISACSGSSRPDSSAPPLSHVAEDAQPEFVAEPPSPVEALGHPSSELIPRSVFFGNPDKASPTLSPDGASLAFLADREGVLNVWVGPTSAIDAAKAVTAETLRPVRSFFWAHDNAHILYLQDAGGDENWHVFSVEVATGSTIDLTPFDSIAARVVGISPRFPTKVVIGINDRVAQLHDLYTVDILSGERTLLQENPGFVSMTVDEDLVVRLASQMMPDGGLRIMQPPAASKTKGKAAPPESEASALSSWTELLAISQDDAMTTAPIDFDKSGKRLFLWDSRQSNTSALISLDLRSKKRTVIANNALADGERVLFHPRTKKPLAVSFNYDRREWKLLDPSLKKDFDKLAALSDGEADVISSSYDNNLWVVAFNDDDGPLQYYLWNRKNQHADFLFANRKALVGLKLAKMHAQVIDTSDGIKLVNYLSLPVAADPEGDGKPKEALPMVLLVHGGPWGRDSWGYNPLHQLLSSRGYAVLSVNFRGSTGFGKAFINAANMEWAGKMHDDLIDSVDWAIEEGIARADKVCIMGGSYGGYATLVGLTFTPDRFACGVDIVGPSNIITLLEAIPAYWKPMQDMFKVRVGDWTSADGREMLTQRSPLNRVDQIQKPLLIGQGANDPRVKQAEADQIVAAMQERDIPVSYVLFPDEGHGFHRPPNSLAFWAATEAFLSAHLGGLYQPADAAELSGTTMQVPAGAHGIPGFGELLPALKKAP